MNYTTRVFRSCMPLLSVAPTRSAPCRASGCRAFCLLLHNTELRSSPFVPLVATASHHMPVVTATRSMAGHSKWQNIRHIKAEKDGIKRRTNEKLVHRIKLAVKEGGSADPKVNSRLASILLEGKKNNVPNATMENALKMSDKVLSVGKTQYMEVLGPGNCHIMIEAFTDRDKWCRYSIQAILKKHWCSLGAGGIASHSFEQKGVIQSELPESGFDLDAATDAAIEAGAEDVEETMNDDGQEVLQFICGPKDLHAVRKELEGQDYKTLVARMEYIPIMNVAVSEEQFEVFTKLADALEDHENVMRIYSNIEVQSS